MTSFFQSCSLEESILCWFFKNHFKSKNSGIIRANNFLRNISFGPVKESTFFEACIRPFFLSRSGNRAHANEIYKSSLILIDSFRR